MEALTIKEIEKLLDSKLEPIHNSLESIKTDISSINQRLNGVETHVRSINERLYKIENRMANLEVKFDQHVAQAV